MSFNNNVRTSRAHDYKYDPVYQVSDSKDLRKQVYASSLDTAQVDVAPVFSNMFSELPNYSSQHLVLRNDVNVDTQKLWNEKQADLSRKPKIKRFIGGKEVTDYLKVPVVTLTPSMMCAKANREVQSLSKPIIPKLPNENVTRETQTMYRESSAQTTPWKTPHYKKMEGGDPEVCKLNFLNYHLPAGVHEVELILQARRRRGWEKLLPDVDDKDGAEKRNQILIAIELDRWVFREEEIHYIQQMRLELLEQMVNEYLESTMDKTQRKLNHIAERLQKEKAQKLMKHRHCKERELRRLYRRTYGITEKYRKVNVIDEHIDYKSELYGPLMRFGENPKRGHMVIKQTYEPAMIGVEEFSTLPRWLHDSKLINESNIKLPGRRLCIRETKWTEPILKQLHEELSQLRKTTTFKCSLRKRIVKEEALDDTVRVSMVPDGELDNYAAAIILQSIIRGRATQTLIYEGRDRCRELIQELQSTHALVLAQRDEVRKKRMKVLGQQRDAEVQSIREMNVEEILNKLQGCIVGTMLDFLNKELVRIMDERKAHAIALLYERERRDKEAAEAGRRQIEEQRRKEHDEMFKQVVKVHQETVDVYLKDIITEGMQHVSKEQAEAYVTSLTEQIKDDITLKPEKFLDKEELIADMICHFVIPEVEKQTIRDKILDNQKKHLHAAHKTIYQKIETLPVKSNYDYDNEYFNVISVQSELPPLPEHVPEPGRMPLATVHPKPRIQSAKQRSCNVGIQFPEMSPDAADAIFMCSYVEEVTHCNIY